MSPQGRPAHLQATPPRSREGPARARAGGAAGGGAVPGLEAAEAARWPLDQRLGPSKRRLPVGRFRSVQSKNSRTCFLCSGPYQKESCHACAREESVPPLDLSTASRPAGQPASHPLDRRAGRPQFQSGTGERQRMMMAPPLPHRGLPQRWSGAREGGRASCAASRTSLFMPNNSWL